MCHFIMNYHLRQMILLGGTFFPLDLILQTSYHLCQPPLKHKNPLLWSHLSCFSFFFWIIWEMCCIFSLGVCENVLNFCAQVEIGLHYIFMDKGEKGMKGESSLNY